MMAQCIPNATQCEMSFEEIEPWMHASEVWAFILAVFGGAGNLATLVTFNMKARNSPNEDDPGEDTPLLTSSNRNSGRQRKPLLQIEGGTLLLLHLIACDLLYCTINLPITAAVYHLSRHHEMDKFPDWLCYGSVVFRYANAIAAWMTLGLIMLVRCIDLGRLRNDSIFRTKKAAIISIIVIWCFSLLVPFNVHLGRLTSSPPDESIAGYNNCTCKCDFKEDNVKVVFYVFETMIPSILMIFGCINFYQIWKQKMKLDNLARPEEFDGERIIELRKSSYVLLGLLTLYLVCVIPICIQNIIDLYFNTKAIGKVGFVVYGIYWFNYAIQFNFFSYFFVENIWLPKLL